MQKLPELPGGSVSQQLSHLTALNYLVKMPPITYLDCHSLLGDLGRYIGDLSWKELKRD